MSDIHSTTDDAGPGKGRNGHRPAIWHDTHAAERGPWEERQSGDPEYLCWVRRMGAAWKMIGIGATEEEAYEYFLKHADLQVFPMVLLSNDGNPNDFIAEGGEGGRRLRKRSCDTPKPAVPQDMEERIAHFGKRAELKIPLYPERR